MATTTGTGAKKIAGTDDWRDILDIHNDTVDAYDGKIGTTALPTTAQTLSGAISEQNEAIANLQGSIAYIVGNTNTTGVTLAVGQFVYVKGHSTISEGLRKVTASISANANITTSNTDACSEGGLNALNSKSMIHVSAVTITSNASGYFVSEIPNSTKLINAIVDGYPTMMLTYQGVWYFMVCDPTTGTLKTMPNTSKTITYYWLEQ